MQKMFYRKICFLLLVSLPAIFAATDYCSSSLCGGQPHIACNNNGNFAAKCVKPEVITITAELKKQILDQHNSLRNKIANGYSGFPTAERMATLVWDDELAKLAVLNVKQCEMKHDKCRNTENFPNAGQNIAYKSWYGSDYTVAAVTTGLIQDWFDEVAICPKDVINSYKSPTGASYGHFTAMVRDKSTHIGCGIVRHQDGKFIVQNLACNYAQTNMIGQPIYVAGKTASKCTSGTNASFAGLCSVNEKY